MLHALGSDYQRVCRHWMRSHKSWQTDMDNIVRGSSDDQCFIIIIVWLSFVCKALVGFVWHCFAYACLALHCLTLHRESKNYVIFSCCCIVFLLPRLVPVRYFGLSAIFFTASKTALLQGATTSPATEQTPKLFLNHATAQLA